ncbi:MAG: imidazolonepropionase [Gammaproteobacteria bacterium]|nr:imidazolonepropionase [Gammaproteobacteria bacterium]
MNNKCWDALWINCLIATMKEGDVPYGLLINAALAVKEGQIVWVGLMENLPHPPDALATYIYDGEGRCITPGLIDCHTHLVFAGNRYAEFELRIQGKSYADIAKAGGGIQSTVNATRLASESDLLKESLVRAQALIASGVTTMEIKSGYGLDIETELKMLRVAKQIGEQLPISIKTTFLGAHTVPKEFTGKSDEYIDFICHDMIPLIAKEKLADFVDVFCEDIAFNLVQTECVFKAAQQFQLKIKCHAEQLTCSESAKLAADYNAISVDHLEYLSEIGARAMAQSGSVAVLLPSAFYFLREKKLPPVELLRSLNIPIALATDCNPGTSPVLSLLLVLNMGCVLYHLTPEEALLGVTRHAARALGLETICGSLEVGKKADFIVWNVSHPGELVYWLGLNGIHQCIVQGKLTTSYS